MSGGMECGRKNTGRTQPKQSMKNDEHTWSDWMARAQHGDEDCYRQLLAALGKAIEHYLRSRFGALDFLEDLVQESLMAIHLARHTYAADRPFRPWMFAIVRHKAIDMLRKRDSQRMVADTIAGYEGPAGTDSVDEDSAEALLEGAQLFQDLKPQSRQALILTKVAGYSLQEAAGRLQISEVAMKVRVHRALRELSKQLQRQVPNDSSTGGTRVTGPVLGRGCDEANT